MKRRKFLSVSSGTIAALTGYTSFLSSNRMKNTNSGPSSTGTNGSTGGDITPETVESERPVSKYSFLEVYVVDDLPTDATIYEYNDERVKALEPVRRAVREAVQSESGVGNAGIASEAEKEAIHEIPFVRYGGEIVEVQVMVLT